MNYDSNTSFRQSLSINLRVIGALLLRELVTRYGRNNIGFLWLFLEPLLFTLTIISVRYAVRNNTLTDMTLAFLLTGYPMILMWRNASNRAVGAINANISLLYHRNVKVLDTVFSRILLEIIGATVAQIGLLGVLIFTGLISPPADSFYMLMAWLLMAMFAFGLGFCICVISHHSDPFRKIWGTLSFIMMPLSGAFFYVHNLPPKMQEFFLWIPMVSGTEMFRHGYFGDSVITHERIFYLFFCNLLMIFIGMTYIKRLSYGVEPK